MPDIEHVIVLALENRSFDHMLGFLPHPERAAFDGLGGGGFANPDWPGTAEVAAEANAKTFLPVDPDHSHDAVLEQLAPHGSGRRRRPGNTGFVSSYERKSRGLTSPSFGGLLGPLINWRVGRKTRKQAGPGGRGPLIMQCQPPDQVPVLSGLALGFAVCTRWFCSVPGETWPNRNFMHAATSDGETGIDVRFYTDRTIFELLEEHGKTWHVYHDDTPQLWVFPSLWRTPERHANWFALSDFAGHVASGRLPSYSFLEPNHRPPLHTLDHAPVIGSPSISNSQHPGNNLVKDANYDGCPEVKDTDFVRAEGLIAQVYEALRSNPEVFEKSLLVITYDEHGGFYDHVAPPMDVPAPGDPTGPVARLLDRIYHRKSASFAFTMLGPRVPAIVISPYIPAGHVDPDVHDHASIPATLRAIFAPGAEPLTKRDAWAAPFHTLLTLPEPRRDDLPDLSAYVPAPELALSPEATVEETPVPRHYEDFVAQGDLVREALAEVAEPEVTRLAEQVPDARRAVEISAAFTEAAQRHRH